MKNEDVVKLIGILIAAATLLSWGVMYGLANPEGPAILRGDLVQEQNWGYENDKPKLKQIGGTGIYIEIGESSNFDPVPRLKMDGCTGEKP